jgi:hypothetical protein
MSLLGETSSYALTSGTGEDDIRSKTIYANGLGIGNRMHIVAAGTKVNANGNKTIKFYFGSTAITFHAAANDTNDWRFEADIVYSATSEQKISWVGYNGVTITQGHDTAAEDMTGAVVMKITGECAHASDVIRQYIWDIEKK